MSVPNEAEENRPTAVYRLYDGGGVLLYIGATYNPDRRLTDHRRKPWGPTIARRTVRWYSTRDEAIQAEEAAIAAEHPPHNEIGTPEHGTRCRAKAAATPGKGRVTHDAYLMRLHVADQLRRFGYSDSRATGEGMVVERAYKEASGLFPDGVSYPPLDWIRAKLAE